MSRYLVAVGVLVLGVAVVGSAGAAVVLNPDANLKAQYTYNPYVANAADPHAVCSNEDSWRVVNAGSRTFQGYTTGLTPGQPLTVSYTFTSGDPTMNIATIQPITCVYYHNDINATVAGSYVIGDGEPVEFVFFSVPWNGGDTRYWYEDVIDVNAPSITITYTLFSNSNINTMRNYPAILFDTGTATRDGFVVNATFAPIPEPATMSLLALGGLALLRRKRR